MADEVVASNVKSKESGNMKNLILIFGFSFLATVIIVCTVLLIVFRNTNVNGNANTANTPSHQSEKENEKEIGPLVPLGNEMIVNINGEDGSIHYLKVVVTLEGDSEKAGEELKKRVPQIRDLVITVLTSKTKEKIEEKEGKELIRSEIIKNVNRYMVEGKVRNAYFEDFMMQ